MKSKRNKIPNEHFPKIVAVKKQLRNTRQNQKRNTSKKTSREEFLFRMAGKLHTDI
jgi:hypothetical protein